MIEFIGTRAPEVEKLTSVCTGSLLLATATVHRGQLFRSELSLWQDAANKSRSNTRPHLHYALRLWQLGREAEARQVLAKAQRIDPFDSAIAAYSRAYSSLEAQK